MSLHIAIAVLRYFPYGGLERNMLAIAEELQSRGHHVHIYTLNWEGEKPNNISVTLFKSKGFTNHARAMNFANEFSQASQNANIRVGFNRLPNLNVCYVADACFKEKAINGRHFLYRFSPRSRAFLALENAVAARSSKTQLMFISPQQLADYQHHYSLPDARFILLPPGIKRNRCIPDDYTERRASLREQWKIKKDEKILLALGSDFWRKGLDRSIHAVAKRNDAHLKLWVVGEGNPEKFIALAKSLNVESQIQFLGARDNVEEFLWMSDLLLHPARSEAAGACLVEAIVAGLPIIATQECGFSHYVSQFDMGEVITQHESETLLDEKIHHLLSTPREHWLARAKVAAADTSLFSRSTAAADYIETCAQSVQAP